MPRVKQITRPQDEPISLDEAKQYCRVAVSFTDDDDLIQKILIPAARRHAEDICGRSFASRSYVLYIDEFPSFPFIGSAYAPLFGNFPFYFGYGPVSNYPTASPLQETDRFPFVIPIPNPPVTAITKITYIGQDGLDHNLQPGVDFDVDLASEPARVAPVSGGRWPIGMVAINSVRVYYTAGYTPITDTPADIVDVLINDGASPPNQLLGQVGEYKFVNCIPEDIKIALLMLVVHWYSNREPVVSGRAGSVPNHIDEILIANKDYDFSPVRG